MNTIEQQIAAVFAPFKELPYLFMGSGISRRYYNLPTWENLLRTLAGQTQPDNPMAYEAFRAAVQTQNDMGPAPLSMIATKIEAAFNETCFSNAQLARELEPFASLIKEGSSPFKISVANHIISRSKRSTDPKMADEFSCLKLLGKRSIAGVITTNYDRLAEDLFEGFEVFVGQESLLFCDAQGISEIYKIHGCCQHPNSIIINQRDYDTFESKNAYLAAKLLTIFVEHPIIFLGYSVSDPNIESILKAITGCLSSHNLDKLQKRLIFIQYEPNADAAPDVRGHSLMFEAGRTVEMTRISLNDYMPLYRVLANKKYTYNPRWLRRLKRDIYQLVASNQPVSSFRITDIEDDEALDRLDVVVGVAVASVAGQANNRSHHIPDAAHLFRDILFDDGNFDLQSLVESALTPLLNSHANSLPIYKYISKYRANLGKEPPLGVLDCCKTKYDEFLSPTLLKYRKRDEDQGVRLKSIDAIQATYPNDDRHCIEALRLLAEQEIDAAKLKSYLIKTLERVPSIFEIKGLATDFKRLIRIYDWLTYGKKEGPSRDGPSKTIDAPTA